MKRQTMGMPVCPNPKCGFSHSSWEEKYTDVVKCPKCCTFYRVKKSRGLSFETERVEI